MNSCNTDIFFSNYYHLQSVRFGIAIVIVLHTSSEKHVTSGLFQSRRRSGNQIINAVCFVVFLVLTNFSKKIFQPCYV